MKIRNITYGITHEVPDRHRKFIKDTISGNADDACPEDVERCINCDFQTFGGFCAITGNWKVLDDTPDMSDEPHANELIQKLNRDEEKRLMDEILDQAKDEEIFNYLSENLRIDRKYGKIRLILRGKVISEIDK